MTSIRSSSELRVLLHEANMAHFTGVGPETGYSNGSDGFLIVPDGGTNVLVLRGGKGWKVRASDSRLSLDELSTRELNPALQRYLKQFKYLKGDQVESALKKTWAVCDCSAKGGERIFEVRGKGSGLPHLQAANGNQKLRVDVAILKQKVYKVGFRFLCHPSGSDLNPATRFRPEDAASLVEQVNAIFVPQVNISFELADSAWAPTQRLPQPVTEGAFREHVLPKKSKDADVTVFLVGKWKSNDTDPNGSYIESERAAIIDDKPQHPKQVTSDGFILTLAHELTHFLQHRRKLSGHHGRDRVLMSTGIQSTKIDKQLVADLNAW